VEATDGAPPVPDGMSDAEAGYLARGAPPPPGATYPESGLTVDDHLAYADWYGNQEGGDDPRVTFLNTQPLTGYQHDGACGDAPMDPPRRSFFYRLMLAWSLFFSALAE